MRISWLTTLLGLLADAALLVVSLVSPATLIWLVFVRLALYAVQMLEFLVAREHPKGTDHRRTAFFKRAVLYCLKRYVRCFSS